MRLLHRYILLRVLQHYVLLWAMWFGLFVAIDLIINFDEFFQAANAIQDNSWQRVGVLIASVLRYYYPQLLFFFGTLGGPIVIVASVVTVLAMVRDGELTGLFALGVSPAKIMVPFLIAWLIIQCAIGAVREQVLPEHAASLMQGPSDLKAGGTMLQRIILSDHRGRIFVVGNFHPQSVTIHGLVVRTRATGNSPGSEVTASKAVWDAARGAWRLTGIIGPPPTRSTGEKVYLDTDLDPMAIIALYSSRGRSALSSTTLFRLGYGPQAGRRSQCRQSLQVRYSMIIVSLQVLLICLMLLLVPCRDRYHSVVVRTAAIGLIAWGAPFVFVSLPESLFGPIATAWLPVVMLLPATAYVAFRRRFK